MEIKKLCELAHKNAVKKGFWSNKNIPTKLLLIITEISEACEADRLGDNEQFNQEIADIFIRLSDLVGFLNIDIEEEIRKKMEINKKRPIKHGKRY